jgi:hypothetical protein
MVEKFDLKKNEKELKQVAKDTNTKADSSIFVILNNMQMYNDIVDEYRRGEKTKIYLMYQLNASIFKQLALFGLVPAKVKATAKNDDSALADIIKEVNKR